jgi:hypothetical protein
MQTSARLRLSKDLKDTLQYRASRRSISVSALLREAMRPYLDGRRTLPAKEVHDQETSFACYVQDFAKFKELSKEANIPWDEAMRVIIREHLDYSAPRQEPSAVSATSAVMTPENTGAEDTPITESDQP